ncbi:hypothetical protein HJFPF1_12619 [Paramyrothecium foliicola]|nr:hypothetical protein HJFPF1_12619 [Paramyrothecium foliicola]
MWLVSTPAPVTPSGPQDTSPLDYSSDAVGMMAVCSILIVFSTIFVLLRLWSKRLSGAGWRLDDWLIVAALVIHHCFMATCFVMVIKGGLGRDGRLIIKEDPNSTVILYQAFVASFIRSLTTGILAEEGVVNFTKQFVVPGMATIVEIYVAIVAACLPTLMPLYRKLRYGTAVSTVVVSGTLKTYDMKGRGCWFVTV